MKVLSIGTKVTVNQGFGIQTFGKVVSFDKNPNSLGHKNNYMIEITGGLDAFKQPAQIGKIIKVVQSNVKAI